MKAPMYVRALSPAEQAGIEAGLRSSEAFTLRRSQILLASSREQRPSEIARNLGCATQTVRNAIHAFEQKGLACLKQESCRPKTVQAQFDQAKCEALRALVHQTESTDVRQNDQPLDSRIGRSGLLRARFNHKSGEYRNHPTCPQMAWGRMAACQTLDHQSRSGVCEEKTTA
jgi:transposase